MGMAREIITWCIFLLAVLPCIISAAIRPLETLDEGPLWRQKITDTLLSDDDPSSEDFQTFRRRYPYDDLDTGPEFPIFPRPPSGKRALAMFARWGSINSIGKNRPPIRSNLLNGDGQLSTNNRRMQGQPLRWG
ncbi:unnamed protein product [Phyllotreta striolata]|uniref:Uncharacterized protein n=1 Tax=Phyllotreta striolata TaxID=444603 RepID=A0A9N9XND6_PHYSR|nr:unnamed protein product [Phyllotreta striolata]